MVFDPGVRQARIDLTPTRKSDRRVKKHELALFRLRQYNRFLHVCLCPIVTCSLLLLLYLIAEKHTQQTKSKTCSNSRTSLCTTKKVCANALISRRQCHVCRVVTKCTVQMLLLRAGDVEPNPGPARALNIKNLINELNIIVHKWFEFGIQLGIEFHILKSFEMEHSKDPKRCLSEVLQYWLDGKACEKSQVNWETVIEALESPSINEGAIASRLRETIELPYETSEYGSGSASRTTSDVNYDVQLRPRDTGSSAVTDSNSEHHAVRPQEPEFLCLVHKLRGLQIDHRTELQSRLLYESNEIIKNFNRFIISVRESFDRRGISLERVIEVLMGFGTFTCVSSRAKKFVFEEDFENLKAAESMMKIMEIVRRYCNFFSYDIVEELVTILGDEKDKKNLSKYIEDFNEYAKRKVYECPTELSPVTESGQAIIYVTLDKSYDDCTLSHLQLFHRKLCQILNISSKSVLRLCRIEPGSIKLVFSLPQPLLREILTPLSFEQKERLIALKVIEIKYGHNQFYFTHSLPPPHATSTLKPVHFIETQALGIHQTRKTPRSHDGTDDSSTTFSASFGLDTMLQQNLILRETLSATSIQMESETLQVPHTVGGVPSRLVVCHASTEAIMDQPLIQKKKVLPPTDTTDSSLARPYAFQHTKDASRMIESSQEREQKPMQISSAITPELHSTPQQTAKYKCPACGTKWRMKNSRGGPKTCEHCGKKEIQPYDFSKGQKGTAKYKCPACGEKWKMKSSRGGPKTCEGCGKKDIQPHDFIPDPKRMFGDFNCSTCGRQWASGYTWIEWDETENKWVENWQQCRGCGREVYPSDVRPLRYTSGNASQKPHDSAACEMCQKHGDCRNLRSSEVEEGEWDDSTSVRSEASSISDLSEDQNLSDRTPVNSDEEAIDDLLSSKLKGLHMK